MIVKLENNISGSSSVPDLMVANAPFNENLSLTAPEEGGSASIGDLSLTTPVEEVYNTSEIVYLNLAQNLDLSLPGLPEYNNQDG